MSATVQLPKDGRTYRIWSVVEDLVVDRYSELSDERMRDSYYLLREWLEPLRAAGSIQTAEFDYFVENYEYYRDTFWPRVEKRHGLERPDTKPPTVVIEDGEEFTESHIPAAWPRARGFIFVEKSGMADDLSLLSHHGWLIVAAQGESTRTFREAVAGDGTDRPVLVVTDADHYGDGITESLKGHSIRTEHLDLAEELEDRVRKIGLSRGDADALDLPRERDPTKSPDEWRVELNALTVLKERHGISNPLLAYIVGKMDHLGIPICPLPVDDPEEEVRAALRSAIEAALSDSIGQAVDRVLEAVDPVDDVEQDGHGSLMQLAGTVTFARDEVDLEPVSEELAAVGRSRLDRLEWQRQTRYEEKVRRDAGEEDVETVADAIESGGGQ